MLTSLVPPAYPPNNAPPSPSPPQHYNVCSDRAITFTGIAKAVGKALGKEAKVVLYSPEELGLGKSGKAEGFPFR